MLFEREFIKIRTYPKIRKQVILNKHFKWLNEGGLGFGTRSLEIIQTLLPGG